MAKILIVEDEKNMQEIIAEYLRRGGHTCFTADDGMDALLVLKSNPMDLLILDIMMPHLDGFSVCKIARETSSLPIIMLTAKGSEEDKLKGYDLGADDYLVKPFGMMEMVSRVKAVLRRCRPTQNREILTAGDLVVDLAEHTVTADGERIALTFKEF